MGRGPISRHRSFDPRVMRRCGLIWFYSRFPEAIPFREVGCPRVTHPFATFFLSCPPEGFLSRFLVRLACVKHTASVRPEPGSNSQLKFISCSLFANFCSSSFFLFYPEVTLSLRLLTFVGILVFPGFMVCLYSLFYDLACRCRQLLYDNLSASFCQALF